MKFERLKGRYAVCALQEPVMPGGEFVSLTVSGSEVSLVCEEEKVPAGCNAETGWRALKVEGPLDFSLVGVMAHISSVLAETGVSLFAVSTYETDYVLVKEDRLQTAVEALTAQGHTVL